MIIKASGRSALIFAAGLFVLLATPVNAADDDDLATTDAKSNGSTAAPVTRRIYRHASHHRRHYAHHKLHAIAKADHDDRNKKPVAADAAADNPKGLPNIPPSIANANAQMLLAGAPVNAAAAISAETGVRATASDTPANASTDHETLMVAADQLNDVDRTLRQGTPTATVTSPSTPAATMTGESSAWDQTSLIGKIFIGFGALLTVASAARMFIT
jgi:hypothetical protein